jgi:hypothetical protein
MVVAPVTSTLNLSYPALMGSLPESVMQRNVAVLHTIVFAVLALAAFQSLLTCGQEFGVGALGEQIIVQLRIQL